MLTVVVDRLVIGQPRTRGRSMGTSTLAESTGARVNTAGACPRLGPGARTGGKIPSQSVPISVPGHGAMPTPRTFFFTFLQCYIEFTWPSYRAWKIFTKAILFVYILVFSLGGERVVSKESWDFPQRADTGVPSVIHLVGLISHFWKCSNLKTLNFKFVQCEKCTLRQLHSLLPIRAIPNKQLIFCSRWDMSTNHVVFKCCLLIFHIFLERNSNHQLN